MNQCNKFGRKLRILSLCFILLAAVTVFAVTPFAFAEDQTVSDETAAEEGAAGILEEEPFIPPASFTNVAPFGDPVQGTAPAYAVQAANDGAETDDGMVLSKTATANDDGSYTIQMEAYATGSKIISEVSKDVPTDIVLVLDQSGSMAENMGTVSFEQYKDESTWYDTTYHTRNQDYYEYRHNGGSGNLWHKLADDSYVSVSVERQGTVGYTGITNGRNESSGGWGGSFTNLYDNRDNLYALVSGVYQKVTVTTSGRGNNKTYTYTLPDGTEIASSQGQNSSPTISNTDDNKLYLAAVDDTQTVYTYTYTDSNGNVQTIGTSTGADTVFSPTLYKRVIDTSSGISKLDALKSAVTSFVNSVSRKALGADGQYGTEDDIAHRIAIVGFASNSSNNNTELLSTGNVTDYWSANNASYSDALVSACGTNGNVNPRLSKAIDNLSANGDTYLEYGMDMANKIFVQYPITAEDTSGRQRVVVVFTDGYPAPSNTNDFNYSMANSAIQNANASKQTYGATVYTVGVFSTADPAADIETNFATSDGWSNNKNNLTDQQEAVAANRYMHYVSSNFPGATSLNQGGSMNPNANPFAGGDSYYLSAADANDLNNIFKQISENVESGGTSSTLTSSSVVKDVISPYFTLPEGTTADGITLETYACTGKNGSDYTWSKNADAMGANAIISGDQVSVTGFNFSENYVGTVTEGDKVTYRGHKLVISFKVTPKPGFLGGNNVPTNANAGIYAKEGDASAVKTFGVPTVNVSIPKITVNAAEKNVYLLQNPTDDQLRAGMTVKCGDVDITDPSRLAGWQKEFVTIDTPSVSKSDGFNATADGTYTITASVSPKDDGSEEAESGTGTANINVFKPEVTFKDSQIYLGQTVENYDVNLADVQWKHEDTIADSTNMGGASAPELTYSYNPINPSEYDFKKDTGVKVTDVTIDGTPVNDCVTFKHQDCDVLGNNCQFGKGDFTDCNFIVHVKGFDLKIEKRGAEDIDENQSFIFNVQRWDDAAKNWVLVTQAVVLGNSYVTITELPIGTYRVVEDQNWSWRYNLQSVTGGVIGDMQPFANQVTFDGVNGDLSKTLIFTNTRTQTKWLNGSAFCQNYWTKDADGNWKVEKHTFPNQENN